MEADADQEELARHRSVFAACDAHRSGRLQREFSALSAEHRVRPADAEAVFQRLDSDRDGVITFQEFARGCRGARRGGRRRGCEQHGPALSVSWATSDPGESEEDDGHEDAAAAALAVPWGQASPGRGRQDFQARLGDEAKFIPRSSRSSYVDEDCDSLALCDPMQRMNCEVDSLPESCFTSGLSTLRDSNEYDSEVEYRPQRAFQRSHGTQESFAGDASATDTAIVDDDNSYRSQKAYQIVLAGDAGVGKTSFLMRFCKNEFRRNTSATVGVDFQMKTLLVDGERTVLQLWDTAGTERYRSIVKCYFRRADGVLLLYDVTRVESFLNVQEWVREIKDAATENTPIMLVGNKADLRDAAAEVQRCVPRYYGEKQAMKYGALFCETSAKDGSKIKEAVLRLAREVKKRTKKDDSKSIINLTEGSSKQSTRKKSCCKR